MIAIVPYQIIIVGSETSMILRIIVSIVIPQVIQGILKFLFVMDTTHGELLSKLSIGNLSGGSFKDPGAAGKGIFHTVNLHSGMVQSQTDPVQIFIGGTQIVNVQVHVQGRSPTTKTAAVGGHGFGF